MSTTKPLTPNEALLVACLLSAMKTDAKPIGRIDFDSIVPVIQGLEGSMVGERGVVQRWERLRDRFRGEVGRSEVGGGDGGGGNGRKGKGEEKGKGEGKGKGKGVDIGKGEDKSKGKTKPKTKATANAKSDGRATTMPKEENRKTSKTSNEEENIDISPIPEMESARAKRERTTPPKNGTKGRDEESQLTNRTQSLAMDEDSDEFVWV